MTENNSTKLIMSLLLSFFIFIVGLLPVIFSGGFAWYDGLNKPFFAPPDWLFGPAWAIVFFFDAIALYLVWLKWPGKEAKMSMSLYVAVLALSVVWVFLFFGQQSVSGLLLSLAEIVVLLAMAAMTAYRFYLLDRRAGYLMVPFLLWVVYVAAANAAIWLASPGA